MSTYAIGDVHGCAQSLKELLAKLPSDGNIVFIGDVVNRGPQSLETLRIIQGLGERAVSILGNHELHMLAVYAGKRELHRKDTIKEIFDAPDGKELIDWIRTWPMALDVENVLCVHAACHWKWNKKKTLKLAHEVENYLRSDNWQENMGELFGKTQWSKELEGFKRLRAIINVLTRTRFLTANGEMDYDAKLSPAETSSELIPWFKYPDRKTAEDKVTFGHWSTLGLIEWPNIYPLDTGCLWGGALTARNLENPEEIFQVKPFYGAVKWLTRCYSHL